MKLSLIIEELVEEKGLDRSVLSSIICEGILAAYQKRYPALKLNVNYDKKADEVEVFVEKVAVATVADEDTEISLRKAKTLSPKAKAGETVQVPFTGSIGRIEIIRAKQIIAGRIRAIEAAAIYHEFKSKEGAIVVGTVHKCERNGTVVKLQDHLGFLPKSLSIPEEKCVVGAPIRALLKEVLPEPRNENQLILDRVSSDFLHRLFELEIPEVYEKLVEIKKIVRVPGYKSKVIVVSHDKNIDPIGTCVGVGGVRIKPILRELNNEKIDIIGGSDTLEALVRDSLKPAEVARVEIVDDKNARVWLNEDQRSLAIGRMGQNIQLASRLTGLNIHLVKPEVTTDRDAAQEVEEASNSESFE